MEVHEILCVWIVVELTSSPFAMGLHAEEREITMCVTLKDHVMDFTNHNLTEIPKNLPKHTEYLDVSYNNISNLNSGPLHDLIQLCCLKATHCNLQFIFPSTFANNHHMRILNVSHNLLKTIPEVAAFRLRVIDLSSNEYSSYSLPHSFAKLQDLDTLVLGSKTASSVRLKDFAPLQHGPLRHLILGEGIQLQEYEPGSLAQLKSLKEITLNISFCQNFDIFEQIIVDLNQTQTQMVNLVQFVPDDCNVVVDPFRSLKQCYRLQNLTITETWINSTFLVKLIEDVWDSSVLHLTFINDVYNEDVPFQLPKQNTTSTLQSVTVNRIRHYQYKYPIISVSMAEATHFSYLKFSGTGLNILPCNLLSVVPSLQTLDLSDNLLREEGFWYYLCTPTKAFPALRHLSLSRNRFTKLDFISKQASEMKLLESLDLSFNSIQLTGSCSWSPNLTELSLSHNNLGNDIFKCLSPNFKKIDLSKTGITAISQDVLLSLPSLTHLILSSNDIQVIPLNLRAPLLHSLFIDQNAITYISEGVLDGLPKLETLVAGKNPFSCTCDSYWFVTALNKSLLPDWPLDYTCSTPLSYVDESLVNLKFRNLSCHPWLQAAVSLSVLTVVFGIFAITFHVCDGVWYTKMLWVWIRAKRRVRKGDDRLLKCSFSYHAFISYSQHDSDWVDTQLVRTLEGAGLSLCIHERDFVPGQWILDNIINCVEASYKTIFVLSQNFVQSDWCNYELFFAQHRAISMDDDSVVFILLEPIPCDTLPRKFLKLRALLRQQTYLEWPKDECKKQLFWKSLRSMLQTGDKGIALRDAAQDIMDTCSLLPNQS